MYVCIYIITYIHMKFDDHGIYMYVKCIYAYTYIYIYIHIYTYRARCNRRDIKIQYMTGG